MVFSRSLDFLYTVMSSINRDTYSSFLTWSLYFIFLAYSSWLEPPVQLTRFCFDPVGNAFSLFTSMYDVSFVYKMLLGSDSGNPSAIFFFCFLFAVSATPSIVLAAFMMFSWSLAFNSLIMEHLGTVFFHVLLEVLRPCRVNFMKNDPILSSILKMIYIFFTVALITSSMKAGAMSVFFTLCPQPVVHVHSKHSINVDWTITTKISWGFTVC